LEVIALSHCGWCSPLQVDLKNGIDDVVYLFACIWRLNLCSSACWYEIAERDQFQAHDSMPRPDAKATAGLRDSDLDATR